MGYIPKETFISLRNEKNFSQRISKIWNCTLTKLGKSYSPDFAISRNNEIVAFLELKCSIGMASTICQTESDQITSPQI